MSSLADDFKKVVHGIGMSELTHPIFYTLLDEARLSGGIKLRDAPGYNVPGGIRFEIGTGDSVYLDQTGEEDRMVNPSYVSQAFGRAEAIFKKLPYPPNLLRIDGHPDGNQVKEEILTVCRASGLPDPHEQVLEEVLLEDGEASFLRIQMYWDLERIPAVSDRLMKEIIMADIGGYSGFASSVYFADTRHRVLFHLYDDRGADLAAADKELIRPLYEKFQSWILDYDREKIEKEFEICDDR